MENVLNWPVWPQFDQEHEEAVLRVIRSNQLFAAKEVAAFELEFKEYIDSKQALGVGNATQGLQLALAALGVGAGDEVIVTPYSWISSASCVLMQNAIPVFVDIESESFGICPKAVIKAITKRTKAIILVHMFGLSSRVLEIEDICKEHSIFLIEDASHAHGARLNGKHLGTYGDVGVFSLHQRKAIAAGDGGVICTNNESIYDKIKGLRSFGDKQLSYNYRMTEFAAAIARVGLRRIERENLIRRRNHKILSRNITTPKIKMIEAIEGAEPVYYSNLLTIDLPLQKQEKIIRNANLLGIPLKRTWQPLNKHPHFKKENMINEITPWDKNGSTYIEPSELRLKISERYQQELLFEIETHPLVEEKDVKKAAMILDELVTL